MLNQNTMTLRGKISLNIFLVCKMLFPPTKLFESSANRGFGGLVCFDFFYVTGFAAKLFLKCSCVKWCESWYCGYSQRKI